MEDAHSAGAAPVPVPRLSQLIVRHQVCQRAAAAAERDAVLARTIILWVQRVHKVVPVATPVPAILFEDVGVQAAAPAKSDDVAVAAQSEERTRVEAPAVPHQFVPLRLEHLSVPHGHVHCADFGPGIRAVQGHPVGDGAAIAAQRNGVARRHAWCLAIVNAERMPPLHPRGAIPLVHVHGPGVLGCRVPVGVHQLATIVGARQAKGDDRAILAQ